MTLRYLLQYTEKERVRVFQCDTRGRQQSIDSSEWKEYLSSEVESICARDFNGKTYSCILLRNSKPRFVK